MRESVTYQAILREGQAEGRLQEGISLVIGLLSRKFETLTAPERKRIETLTIEQIESLALALLDFNSRADLDAWLEAK